MLEVLDGIYVRSAQPDHAIEKDGPPPISPQHFLCHIRAGTLPAAQQVSCHPPALAIGLLALASALAGVVVVSSSTDWVPSSGALVIGGDRPPRTCEDAYAIPTRVKRLDQGSMLR